MVAIKIDQAAKPPGVAGQAREDLDLGVPVVLRAIGGPYVQYRWNVVSKPNDLTTYAGAVLSSPLTSTTQLSPIDVAGTYLIEIVVDSGSGLGALNTDRARLTFYAGPTLNPDPILLPRREPAFGERTEHNVPDAVDSTGNREGWAREKLRDKVLRDDLWNGRLWAGGRVETIGGPTATLLRSYNVASVAYIAGPPIRYQINFVSPMPDTNYSVFVSGIISVGNAFPVSTVHSFTTNFCVVTFIDGTVGPASAVADFSFRVELGVDP